MAIKIASWNVEGRLHGYQKSGRGTAKHILRGIAELDADVLVLPEFYMDSLAPGAQERLKKMGYDMFTTGYDDLARDEAEREKWGEMHIGILSRLPVSDVRIIRPGGVRNLLMCQVKDEKSGRNLRVIATHLDDRTEASRIRQVEELIKIIGKTGVPTVMLGDFNAMWPKGRARLLRSKLVRFLAKLMPGAAFRSLVERVAEMADGSTLGRLAAHTHLHDVDPRRRPTTTPKMRFTPHFPSVRIIQIDHIFVSPEVGANDFKIAKDGGSDHRAISARLTIDSPAPSAENRNNQGREK